MKRKSWISIFSIALIFMLSTFVYAVNEWDTLRSVTAADSKNADGSEVTLPVTSLYKTDYNGKTAIAIVPYSALGTVGQVNLPNGSTAVSATGYITEFPLCNGDASQCTAANQKARRRTAITIPLAGTIIEQQMYGFFGVEVNSMNFGGSSVSSTDAALLVKVKRPL